MNIKRILMSAVLAAGMFVSSTGCSGNSATSGNVGYITLADGDKIAVIEIKDYGTMKAKLFPDIAPVGVQNFIELAESGYYNGLKIHRVIKDNVIQGGSLYGDGTGGVAAYTGAEEKEDTDNPVTTFPIEINENARNFYGALGYVADKYGQNSVQFYIINNKTPQDIRATDASKVQSRAAELASEAEAATWEASSEKSKINSYQQSYYNNNASMLNSKNDDAAYKYSKTGGVYQYDGGYTVFGQVFEGFDVLDKLTEVSVKTNAQGEKSMPIDDIIISSVTIETYTSSTAEAESESDKKTSSKPNKTPAADSKPEQTSTSETAKDTSEDEGNAVTAESVITTVDTKDSE